MRAASVRGPPGPPRSKENRSATIEGKPAAGQVTTPGSRSWRHHAPLWPHPLLRAAPEPRTQKILESSRAHSTAKSPRSPRSLSAITAKPLCDHREASTITAKPPRSPKRRLQPGAPRLPASGLGPATVLLTRRPDFCTGGDCDRPPGGQPDTASELRQCPHTGGTEPKMCQGVGSFPSHQWGDFRDVSAHNAGGVTSMPVSGPLSTRSGTHREGSLNA